MELQHVLPNLTLCNNYLLTAPGLSSIEKHITENILYKSLLSQPTLLLTEPIRSSQSLQVSYRKFRRNCHSFYVVLPKETRHLEVLFRFVVGIFASIVHLVYQELNILVINSNHQDLPKTKSWKEIRTTSKNLLHISIQNENQEPRAIPTESIGLKRDLTPPPLVVTEVRLYLAGSKAKGRIWMKIPPENLLIFLSSPEMLQKAQENLHRSPVSYYSKTGVKNFGNSRSLVQPTLRKAMEGSEIYPYVHDLDLAHMLVGAVNVAVFLVKAKSIENNYLKLNGRPFLIYGRKQGQLRSARRFLRDILGEMFILLGALLCQNLRLSKRRRNTILFFVAGSIIISHSYRGYLINYIREKVFLERGIASFGELREINYKIFSEPCLLTLKDFLEAEREKRNRQSGRRRLEDKLNYATLYRVMMEDDVACVVKPGEVNDLDLMRVDLKRSLQNCHYGREIRNRGTEEQKKIYSRQFLNTDGFPLLSLHDVLEMKMTIFSWLQASFCLFNVDIYYDQGCEN
ncbi:unnamed protein product [Allacma fusca]|uniref:Uncharacterized protein n=1 Tax=Allacma fusca TaxID=39272 RepID=A0A8J2LP11_9HEXA|nr:unnamed protein product [Allacma fusca]